MAALSELSPEQLATIASAFAALAALGVSIAQVAIQAKAHREEARQRARTAYAALWAEQFQLHAKAMRWQRMDLVLESKLGNFAPDELRPQNWSTVLALLGELGQPMAQYAAYAAVLADDAALSGRAIVNGAENWARYVEELRSREQVTREQAEEEWGRRMRKEETTAKDLARRAAALMDDAINLSAIHHRLDRISVEAGKSEDAQRFFVLFTKAQSEAAKPRSRLARLGARLIGVLTE